MPSPPCWLLSRGLKKQASFNHAMLLWNKYLYSNWTQRGTKAQWKPSYDISFNGRLFAICLLKHALICSMFDLDLHKILMMVDFQSMLEPRGRREKLTSGKAWMGAGNLLKDAFCLWSDLCNEKDLFFWSRQFRDLSQCWAFLKMCLILLYRSDIP